MSKRLFQSFFSLLLLVTALGACTGSPLGNDEDPDCSDPYGEGSGGGEGCAPIVIGSGS